jgi:hypothetical protein
LFYSPLMKCEENVVPIHKYQNVYNKWK